MKHIVHNYGLHIGHIEVRGVTSSSVFLIGDSKTIRLQSYFDTPPESLVIGPFIPVETTTGVQEEEEPDETDGVRK